MDLWQHEQRHKNDTCTCMQAAARGTRGGGERQLIQIRGCSCTCSRASIGNTSIVIASSFHPYPLSLATPGSYGLINPLCSCDNLQISGAGQGQGRAAVKWGVCCGRSLMNLPQHVRAVPKQVDSSGGCATEMRDLSITVREEGEGGERGGRQHSLSPLIYGA